MRMNLFANQTWKYVIGSSPRTRACVTMLIAAVVSLSVAQAQTQQISPDQLAGIQKDTARHFGDAPEDPGPKASDLSSKLSRPDVARAMRKVADWELARSQPYFDRIWTWSVLYTGFMAASSALHDEKYEQAMDAMGTKFNWQLRSALPSADDQSVGQTYTELYLLHHQAQMIAPTRAALDRLMTSPPLAVPEHQAPIPWWWCDALFMAPPVWVRMYTATGDHKYLDYLNQHWWETSKLLYDPSRHLYYRDATYLHKTNEQGNPIFWSRGNGWVIAGIARTLEYLPKNDPDRSRYEQQLRQMAAALTQLQDPSDGLWHSDLLDSKDYPLPETSGSALITFALVWGVEHGQLSRATYMPVIAKAWRGLVGQIYADGRLGCIQQTGAAPAHYLPSSSYNYGIGAFLLAGSEVMQIAGTHKAAKPKHS